MMKWIIVMILSLSSAGCYTVLRTSSVGDDVGAEKATPTGRWDAYEGDEAWWESRQADSDQDAEIAGDHNYGRRRNFFATPTSHIGSAAAGVGVFVGSFGNHTPVVIVDPHTTSTTSNDTVMPGHDDQGTTAVKSGARTFNQRSTATTKNRRK